MAIAGACFAAALASAGIVRPPAAAPAAAAVREMTAEEWADVVRENQDSVPAEVLLGAPDSDGSLQSALAGRAVGVEQFRQAAHSALATSQQVAAAVPPSAVVMAQALAEVELAPGLSGPRIIGAIDADSVECASETAELVQALVRRLPRRGSRRTP
jgi:hypothetical protein